MKLVHQKLFLFVLLKRALLGLSLIFSVGIAAASEEGPDKTDPRYKPHINYEQRDTVSDVVIQCQYKPEEYADNGFEWVDMPPYAITINRASATSLSGRFEGQEVQVREGYVLKNEDGYIYRPGSSWVKGETVFSMTFRLLKVESPEETATADSLAVAAGEPLAPLEEGAEGSVRRVLDANFSSSDRLTSPKDQERFEKERARFIYVNLRETDYLTTTENDGEVHDEQLTSVAVRCEVVRPGTAPSWVK